jgi:hypothetical protein
MIAMTVKMMKLVMKIPWNSFASWSVNPDNEPPLLSAAMLALSFFGLAAVTAHDPRGRVERGFGHHVWILPVVTGRTCSAHPMKA